MIEKNIITNIFMQNYNNPKENNNLSFTSTIYKIILININRATIWIHMKK